MSAAPLASAPSSALRTLVAGWSTSVLVVLVVTAVALAIPHARGIGFPLALRLAVVVPAALAFSIGAAFLHRRLATSHTRPRRVLAVVLAVLAGLVAALAASRGPAGTLAVAMPSVFAGAAAVVWLVPASGERLRSRFARAALVLFGALEILGAALAASTESVPSPAPGSAAFPIAREVFDVEHRFLDLPDGSKIHYLDEGKGSALLFLHGNPSWSFQWRDLVRGLRDTHRCVALDYPGFGMSEAPAGFGYTPSEESLVVDAFVEKLDLRDVTLVMQDWGGPIGLSFAGRHPERVRSVVLGSTWISPTTTDLPRGKFSFLVGGPIGEFAQINFNAFVAAGQGGGVVRELSAAEREGYLRPFVPLSRRGIAAFYPGQIIDANPWFVEVDAGLARLADKEALIYWAKRDPGSDGADVARFERAFPKHRTIELPEADHFFFEDVADEMIADIRSFTSDAASAKR